MCNVYKYKCDYLYDIWFYMKAIIKDTYTINIYIPNSFTDIFQGFCLDFKNTDFHLIPLNCGFQISLPDIKVLYITER